MSKAYTSYLINHIASVNEAYKWLVDHKIIKDEFLPLMKNHDLSKWSEEEYKAYDKYFYGKEKTNEVKEAFDFAWLHHIHNNPHHWQYWVLVSDEDKTKALEMPEEFVIEMFCDHWAFSHKSGNLREIFDWYETHKTNMILHRNTKVAYEALLNQVKSELDSIDKV